VDNLCGGYVSAADGIDTLIEHPHISKMTPFGYSAGRLLVLMRVEIHILCDKQSAADRFELILTVGHFSQPAFGSLGGSEQPISSAEDRNNVS
jgi:hypothetical protein